MFSNKLTRLINESRVHRVSIPWDVALSAINGIPSFIFKSNKTQFVALMMFYKKWNDEVNKNLDIASDEWIREQCRQCYDRYGKY